MISKKIFPLYDCPNLFHYDTFVVLLHKVSLQNVISFLSFRKGRAKCSSPRFSNFKNSLYPYGLKSTVLVLPKNILPEAKGFQTPFKKSWITNSRKVKSVLAGFLFSTLSTELFYTWMGSMTTPAFTYEGVTDKSLFVGSVISSNIRCRLYQYEGVSFSLLLLGSIISVWEPLRLTFYAKVNFVYVVPDCTSWSIILMNISASKLLVSEISKFIWYLKCFLLCPDNLMEQVILRTWISEYLKL